MAKLVLVDDHVLLRHGLAELVCNLGDTVLFEADNGIDFIARLTPYLLPDIVLMDINMPGMDGYETSRWLKINHPEIKVLAISMYNKESTVIRMILCGARGFVGKDCEPLELKQAIDTVMHSGYYYNGPLNNKIFHAASTMYESHQLAEVIVLDERETAFLRYTCTEFTYMEIAGRMSVDTAVIDHYRDTLFSKLGVRTRVHLVLFAISSGIFNNDDRA